MLLYFLLFLIPISAIPLNNFKSNCSCEISSCIKSIFCSNGSTIDSINQRSNKKIQFGKLKLKKGISNDELPIARVEGHTRSRLLKRSTTEGSQEDDSDLIRVPKQENTIGQQTRNQGISAKHIIDKNQSKISKLMKNRSETGMNTKCNSKELKELMLKSISDNSSASKRSINDRAEEKFGGSIDVICSKGHFSYVYSSNLYCEAMKGNVTCIAFRQTR
uniref:Ground-like domain-containing protein n=1 Tax=Brugia malayi TaxID=6279 RepID=A0A8L7SYV3_BRUMA